MAFTDKYANFDLATGNNDGSSEANAWQTVAAVNAGVAAGNRVNIKRQASPYLLPGGAHVDFTVNGTPTAPIWYRCYATTPGDGGMWQVRTNVADAYSLRFTGNYSWVEGLDFGLGTAYNLNAVHVYGLGSWVIRSRIHQTTDGQYANAIASYFQITGGRTRYLYFGGANSQNGRVHGCYIRDDRSGGGTTPILRADVYLSNVAYTDCVVVGNGGTPALLVDRGSDGIGVLVSRCHFYNFTDGVLIDEEPNAITEIVTVRDCVFSTMSGYAVKRTNTYGGFVRLVRNYYHSCTSGFTDYPTEAEVVPAIALSASPFVDPANGDLGINNTANGGAVLRALTYPLDPTA